MNSAGGITYSEAWDMTIQLRRYNIKKISEKIEKHNDDITKKNGETSMNDILNKKIVVPDYIAKAPIKK